MVKRYSMKRAWGKVFGSEYEKCESYRKLKNDKETGCAGRYRMNISNNPEDKDFMYRMCRTCPIRVKLEEEH